MWVKIHIQVRTARLKPWGPTKKKDRCLKTWKTRRGKCWSGQDGLQVPPWKTLQLINIFKYWIYLFYVHEWLPACIYKQMCIPSIYSNHKATSIWSSSHFAPPELELRMVASCLVGAGNRTPDLHKRASVLSHCSISPAPIFFSLLAQHMKKSVHLFYEY